MRISQPLRRRTPRSRALAPSVQRVVSEMLEPRRLLTTYVVDSTADTIANDSEFTLREAIEAANAHANVNGADSIEFDIAGAGPHSIVLDIDGLGGLVVSDPVVIDGYTQDGAQTNLQSAGSDAILQILLTTDISGNAQAHAITLASGSSGSIIKGLAFDGSHLYSGVKVESDSNAIVGNFLGMLPDGTVGEGLNTSGVTVTGEGNVIGGVLPADRNVIGGAFYGVRVEGDQNIVVNNYVGTDPSGTEKRSAGWGVWVSGDENQIGGTLPGQGNLISGNDGGFAGVALFGAKNVVQGNRIGTDASGDNPLPNDAGVFIGTDGATDNLIGGTAPGAGNVIAFNNQDGVYVGLYGAGNPARNAILSNSIFKNGLIGIDLDAGGIFPGDGATANDIGDPDDGPNQLTNKPEITSAVYDEANDQTALTGVIEGKQNTTYLIQIFANPASLPAQARTIVGRITVTTNNEGVAAFAHSIDGLVTEGDTITATATIKNGTVYEDTSEISAPLTVQTEFVEPTVTVSNADAYSNEGNLGDAKPVKFVLLISKPSPYPVTVHYHTESDTATEGVDYTGVTGTFTFAPGQISTGAFIVKTIGDLTVESNEQFKLVIDSVDNGVDGTGVTYGTIQNDDSPPVASVTRQSEVQTLSGGTSKQSNHAGFTGTGFADYGGNNSAVTYALGSSGAGTANLTFRYANGSNANRPVQVLVNNVVVGTLPGAPTGGWSNWTDATLSGVAIPSGAISVKAVANTSAGGANYDKLTVSGTTVTNPPAPTDVTLQAEDFPRGGGTSNQSNHAGFTGTGFADYGGNGSFVTYSVNRANANLTNLIFRYANGSNANRPLQVLVNNVSVGTLSFAPTGGWSSWGKASLNNVSLPSGNVTIKVIATTAAGGANVDALAILEQT